MDAAGLCGQQRLLLDEGIYLDLIKNTALLQQPHQAMGRRIDHASTHTAGAKAAALARERHGAALAAIGAAQQ